MFLFLIYQEEYYGSCRAKLLQIQDTRKRQMAQTEMTMRDKTFLQQQQMQMQQAANFQAQQVAQQAAQQAQTQQMQAMGMMPQAMANNPNNNVMQVPGGSFGMPQMSQAGQPQI